MRQALELAIEWIEKQPEETPHSKYDVDTRYVVLKELEAALAQPEQEPVGKFAKFTDGIWREITNGSAGVSLYTTPPQRTWVGLTMQDAKVIEDNAPSIQMAIFMTEATLKDKNT